VDPTDATASAPPSEQRPGAGPATSGTGSQRGRWAGAYLPMVPFFAYVGLFLLLPTVYVLVGAFQSADGSPSLENISTVLREPRYLLAFGRSVQLSFVSALIGAIVGGLFAWAVSVGGPGGRLRQISVAASGVLAQFGGVMLAFAFLATFGFTGLVTIVL
jgi:putative spermidine/putrescine transport system permease protein